MRRSNTNDLRAHNIREVLTVYSPPLALEITVDRNTCISFVSDQPALLSVISEASILS